VIKLFTSFAVRWCWHQKNYSRITKLYFNKFGVAGGKLREGTQQKFKYGLKWQQQKTNEAAVQAQFNHTISSR
jgi:hypothetical protein